TGSGTLETHLGSQWAGHRGRGTGEWLHRRLHVAGTAEHAFYTIHSKWGQEAMIAAGILPTFTGRTVHGLSVIHPPCRVLSNSGTNN
ncbi:MAG: hypothetical protein RLZZ226_497, partial [Pseudomonadota bacterium]